MRTDIAPESEGFQERKSKACVKSIRKRFSATVEYSIDTVVSDICVKVKKLHQLMATWSSFENPVQQIRRIAKISLHVSLSVNLSGLNICS